MNIIRVGFVNFHYFSQERFMTVDDAVHYARSKGFEAIIEVDGNIVAEWSPISGTKYYKLG